MVDQDFCADCNATRDGRCAAHRGPSRPQHALWTFVLRRDEDESGVSGEGVVAQGVVFTDGAVALRWLTEYRSTGIYNSIEDVERIHGHGGKTKVVFLGV